MNAGPSPPAFSPLDWFADLTSEEKISLFRQVLSEMEQLDPGAENRMRMWKLQKTMCLTFDVPMPSGEVVRDVEFHLFVEEGDRALWRSVLNWAETGTTEFGPGWTSDPAGNSVQGWLASLGIGSLIVLNINGGLGFTASKVKFVPIPEGMRPGSDVPVTLPASEGFTILLFGGQLTIIGNFNNLQPREIRAAQTSPVRIGIAKATDGLMVLGMSVKDLTSGWEGLPFSLPSEPIERRHIMPPDMTGERALLLVLVDRATEKVAVMRPLMMSSTWSAEFERILEFQEDLSGSYTRADYLRDVEEARRRWPSPNDLPKDFSVVELARDNPEI